MMLGDEFCEALYLETLATHKHCTFNPSDCDVDYDTDLYREFQEANFTEYFDPARLYRYCKFY